MKIVRQISTGKILYSSSPDFKEGKGILNARFMFSAIPEADMEEAAENWTQEDYLSAMKTQADATLTYAQKRAREYPSIYDYVDGIVKGDTAQVQKYINDCLAVKAKYPKV